MSFPIRSPRHATRGIFVFARILDKIRLHELGELPPGYTVGPIEGKRTFDDRVCRFLGVDYEALKSKTLEGVSDEAVIAWCFEFGRRPDEEQIEVWNGFMAKRGWNDEASEGLERQKAEAGFGGRSEIRTFFELMDAEEGR